MSTAPLADPETTAIAERRCEPRHLIVQRCLVRPEDGAGRSVDDWHGIVYDISPSGIGVALPIPLGLGMRLVIEPWGKAARTVVGRVVHVRPVEFLWFYGCELDEPLAEEELQAWIS